MDQGGSPALKAERTRAEPESRAGSHARRGPHSRRVRVSSGRLSGRLCKNRFRRQVSFVLSALGLVVIFGTLMQLVFFCKFDWKRGGVSGAFGSQRSLSNVARRLADQGSSRSGSSGLDTHCQRLLEGEGGQEVRWHSAGPGTSEEEGTSPDRRHLLPPRRDTSSGTTDAEDNADTAADDGRRVEGPQRDSPEDHTRVGPSVPVAGTVGESGDVASSGLGPSGTAAGHLPSNATGSPTLGSSTVEGVSLREQGRSSDSGGGGERGIEPSAPPADGVGHSDVLDMSPPPYDDILQAPWLDARLPSYEESVGGAGGGSPHQTFWQPERVEPPPPYEDVLTEDLEQVNHLWSLLRTAAPINSQQVEFVFGNRGGYTDSEE